ncbi:MAG: hypothetical protein AAFR52_00245 [Pseudomonadota bacterium]
MPATRRSRRAALLTGAALVATLAAPPAEAQRVYRTPFLDGLTETIAQTALMFARTGVDLTYSALSVDGRSGDITVSGLVLMPALDWDDARECRVSVARLTLGGGERIDRSSTLVSLSGVEVMAACLEPGPAAMLAGFGYDRVVADAVSLALDYDMASGAASMTLEADIEDAAALTVAADFSYLGLRIAERPPFGDELAEMDPGEAVEDLAPSVVLESAEVTLEDRGLLALVEPMIAQQVGDPAAIPSLLQVALTQALTEGARAPTADEQAFVSGLAEEVGRFLQGAGPLVVSTAPPGGLRLEADTFDTPAATVAALRPVASARPLARAAVLDPALVLAALDTPETLDDADRRAAGLAFASGVGAPRAPGPALALLTPLAEAGDGDAAAALARLMSEGGDDRQAYRFALVAMAAGDTVAVGLADRLEDRLTLDEILAAQETLGIDDGAALALVGAGDVAGLRRLAEAHLTGLGTPRSAEAALVWATLAAAAGDRSAVRLMRRIESRYTARDADLDHFVALRAAASARALEIWTEGGFGAALATP